MGCNCGSNKVIVHVVTTPSGEQRRFTSEARAKEFAASTGGSYAQVVR